ncbi:hypothetical protein [Thiomicrorhabdus sp. Kp2]|uniref:hypothetical protein n=1 Tax=Thiomicrorhabdus sp. Kp2 TaxID=1123518 RepID=UPI0012FF2528|nr:hypothetical protein [Thiomicrorhabdus sp. Kp2]
MNFDNSKTPIIARKQDIKNTCHCESRSDVAIHDNPWRILHWPWEIATPSARNVYS